MDPPGDPESSSEGVEQLGNARLGPSTDRLLARAAYDASSSLQICLLAAAALVAERSRRPRGSDPSWELLVSLQWTTRVLDDALRLADGSSWAARRPTAFDPRELIMAQAGVYRAALSQRRIRLRIGDAHRGLIVRSLPDCFLIAVDHVINNAMRYAEIGSELRFEFSQRTDAGPPREVLGAADVQLAPGWALHALPGQPFIEITIHEFGPPVPQRRRAEVYRAWWEGVDLDDHRGLGLGVVAECTGQLGGRTWLTAGSTRRTQLSLSLPFEVATS